MNTTVIVVICFAVFGYVALKKLESIEAKLKINKADAKEVPMDYGLAHGILFAKAHSLNDDPHGPAVAHSGAAKSCYLPPLGDHGRGPAPPPSS
jgi:hypothetical protein